MIVKDLFCNNESYTHENWIYESLSVGFSRMYYIIDGEAYYREDGEAVRLKKGCLYLTPVKTSHTLYDNPENKLLHTYVHIYTVPAVAKFTEIEVTEGTPIFDAISLWRKYAGTDDKELLVSIVQLVLSCVDRELGRENRAASLAKSYIDKLDNLSVDMSEVARAVGYSREHITRVFSSAYRMTPNQYLNSKRMELARRALQDGKSVKSVADIMSYSSPYAFSKAFKKYFGLSPENYLKTVN